MHRPETSELDDVARDVRRLILETLHRAGSGHVGGPLSVTDILVALYFREMRIDAADPAWPERDRLILSKGHSSAALYAVMAARGFFAREELATFDEIDSRLQAHPDMRALPGIEMSTGSLGQGLSAGVGMALAARVLGGSWRTYVVVGDGEAQEGQIWEASFVAARYGLDGLCAVLDWNGLQQYGWRRPNGPKQERLPSLERPVERWRACGWHAFEVDGHDMTALTDAFEEARSTKGRPTMIVARTVKGRGVSFMEGDYLWHSRPVTDADLASALAELGA